MPIGLTVYGKDKLVQGFRTVAAQLTSVVTEEMRHQMTMLADYVRRTKLSGNPLNRRSGRLSRSISGQASAQGHKVIGVIGSKGVPYAHVHETGGTFDIPAHTRQITMVFGRPVVPHEINVSAHSATFPQRAFLKPSLVEKENDIREALRVRTLNFIEDST